MAWQKGKEKGEGKGTPVLLLLPLLPLLLSMPMLTKEVIRPQVPLRPPCYDFSLVADPRFDSTN
jgi:hypothetical protein